ncbi:MAG: hypothetical protein AAFZ65_15910, partial [Planctomycetota bacterium]
TTVDGARATADRDLVDVAPAPGPTPALDGASPSTADVERVTGRLIVDYAGLELPVESGQVELGVGRESGWAPEEHDVVEGRFELEVAPDDALTSVRILQGELGGRIVMRPQEFGGWRARDGGELVVHADAPRSIDLEVTAAESGEPLDRVTVLQKLGTPGNPPLSQGDHPGVDPERSVAIGLDLASPVSIPIEAMDRRHGLEGMFDGMVFGQAVLFVGAPGRQWKGVTLALQREEPYPGALDVAGAVDLRVTGMPPGEELWLVLRPEDSVGLSERIDHDLERRLDGIPVGTLVGQVVRGSVFTGTRKVFAEAQVEVLPGESVPLTLGVDPGAALRVPTQDVTLELLLDPAWTTEGGVRFSVRCCESADGSTAATGGSLDFAQTRDGMRVDWLSLTAAPHGRYRLISTTYGMVHEFDLAGEERVSLLLPPPVDVTVSILESTGDALVDDVAIKAYGRYRGGSVGIRDRRYERLEDGRQRLRLPANRVRLNLQRNGFPPYSHDFTPSPPAHELTLRWPVWTDVVVVHRSGDQALRELENWQMQIERLDAEVDGRVPQDWTERDGDTVVRFPHPGTYRLWPLEIDGFRSPDPVDVVVAEGVAQTIVFEYEAVE